MPQPRVLVTTSDNYLWALRPFAYLLNKYWWPNPEVIVGGFTPPDFDLPANFRFHSIGPFSDFPVDKWSNALHFFLEEIKDEVFVLMLEDYWVSRPVNTRAVQILYDYMLQFKYVIKMDLTTDRLYAGGQRDYSNVADIELIWSDPDSAYHFSLMAGLWRREHLYHLVIPNETPWQMEIDGTTRLSILREELIVLGTKIQPLKHILALRGGDCENVNLGDLSPDDIQYIRDQGWLDGKQ